MEIFLETSAILSWLFGEKKAGEVIKIINKSKLLVVSKLAVVETRRSLSRALSLNLIKEADYNRLNLIFTEALKGWRQLEIAEDIQKRAGEVFPLEPVRTLDAIHLSSALFCLSAYPKLKLLSFDKKIIENASQLGIELA